MTDFQIYSSGSCQGGRKKLYQCHQLLLMLQVHIYLAIESIIHWDRFISVLFPHAVKSELEFWLQNLKHLNQKRLIQDSLPVSFVFSKKIIQRGSTKIHSQKLALDNF